MMISDLNRLSATEPFPNIGFQIINEISLTDVWSIEIPCPRFCVNEMQDLQGLMYLGRGDFPASDFWKERDVLDINENKEVEIEHVLSKAPLFDYLADGFEIANAGRIA